MAEELELKNSISPENAVESFRKKLKGDWAIQPAPPGWYFDYWLVKKVGEEKIVTAGLAVVETINLPVGKIPKTILKAYSKKFELCSGTLIIIWYLNNILYTFKFPIESMDPLMLTSSIKPSISGDLYDVDLDLLLQHEITIE